MDRIQLTRRISVDMPLGRGFRAYDVVYRGDFSILKDYAQNQGGTAYQYEPEQPWRIREGTSHAVVAIPEGVEWGPGLRLSRYSERCEILEASWLSPP